MIIDIVNKCEPIFDLIPNKLSGISPVYDLFKECFHENIWP